VWGKAILTLPSPKEKDLGEGLYFKMLISYSPHFITCGYFCPLNECYKINRI